jgi:5-methylcytosine-specific restriction endonuclease McrA
VSLWVTTKTCKGQTGPHQYDGSLRTCPECRKYTARTWAASKRQNDPEWAKAQHRKYYDPEKAREYALRHRLENPDCQKKCCVYDPSYSKNYYQNNADAFKARSRARYATKNDECKAWRKAYYARTRDKALASASAWQKKNRVAHNNASSRWYSNNTQKAKTSSRYWRALNYERHRELVRVWAKINRDKRVVNEQRRRALKRNAEGNFTVDDWNRIVEAQEGRCLHCGIECKLTVDHIIPLSKGGTNWPENIQGLCRGCNSRKGASLPEVA